MTLDEILSYDITGRNVAIIGPAGSGKTFLSKLIGNGTHYKIHTDDYINLGFDAAMYAALEVASNVIGNSLVEGIQVYRMLRKGFVLGNWMPKVVIEIERPRFKIEQTYRSERNPEKIKYLKKFQLSNMSILQDYLGMIPQEKKQDWLNWKNEN